jgi:acylphosphatase
MTQQRLHAIISGRVQGVGFRYFVIMAAVERDLTGWVRNLYNGTVEVVAEGEFEALETLLQLLREGPRGSFVDNVAYDWSVATHEFHTFSAGYTA